MKFQSINELLAWRVEQSGAKTAFLFKQNGRWSRISWRRIFESVRFIAQGLHALGIEKGDKVALFCQTRVEWIYSDLAILGCGAVTVPIYHGNPTKDAEFITAHSEAKAIIVENISSIDKILEVRENLPLLEKIILIEGPSPNDEDEDILMLSQIVELGRKQEPGLYEKLAENVTLDDIATIVYTPRSEGLNLGVVHAHRQLIEQQKGIGGVLPVSENDITLLFLPLSHIFGRVIEYMSLYTGLMLAFAESYERLYDNLKEVRPHMIAAVPRVYQKILSSVLKEVELQGEVKRKLLNWCLDIGSEVSDIQQKRRPISKVLKVKYEAAKRIFFDRFKARLGGRVEFLVSSGAPLPKDIGRFFHASGMGILEAYGMTELAGAVTMNAPRDFKIGSVGKPLKETEVVLADDGEILVKGPTVMECYHKEEEATKDVLRDGWLHTGDIGEIDEDGFIRITDRKKDIIITSGGKNISPQNIENHFKADPFIDRIYVHGDQRNFISALVTLNEQNVRQWATDKGLAFLNMEELVKKPELVKLVEQRIQIKNQELASPEMIKKFHVLPVAFTQDGGELTSTNKLRRRLIDRKYRDILDSFYD